MKPAVRSDGYFSREHWVDSKLLHSSSRLSLTPIPEDPVPSSGFQGYYTERYTDMQVEKTLIQIK